MLARTLSPLALCLCLWSPLGAQEMPPQPGASPAPEAPKPAEPAPEAKTKQEKRAEKRAQKLKGAEWVAGLEAMDLDPETKQRVEAALAEVRKTYQEQVAALKAQGGDKARLKELNKAARQSAADKVEQLLGPERWEELRRAHKKSQQEERAKQERAKGKDRPKKGGAQLSSEQVLKAISATEEEQAVLKPLVDGVLETDRLLDGEGTKRQQRYREAVAKTQDPAALGPLLDRYRKEQAEDRATREKARAKLREVLTKPQEARLVALGLLE
ncbi:MAG: hypothetical protein AB7N76_01515 [Planctomycetota bacterium]